jgi:hypothetical protein
MSRSLEQRLRYCRVQGNMTVSDIARWLDRPRATVETWFRGRVPATYYADEVDQKLSFLEAALARGFRVPGGLGWSDRIKVVVEQRDGKRHNHVSKNDPA